MIAKKNRSIVNIRKGIEMISGCYKRHYKDILVVLNNEKGIVLKNMICEVFVDEIVVVSGISPSAIKSFAFDGNK
jgi:hypothetical protein